MGISSFFGLKTLTSNESELPDIFPLNVQLNFFVMTDIMNVYSKILTDCVERIEGIPEKIVPLLWDNFLQSESTFGLITLLADAMTEKKDLFLIYKSDIQLLRQATSNEANQIKIDYQRNGSSTLGIYVSFKNYCKTDMVKIYSSMEYCVVASLNKVMNLSKAIQYKMSDMRGAVSLVDSDVATEQARKIAIALSKGKDVMLDSKDEIVTGTPDISSIKESIAFLDGKKCLYYGLPLSYVNGEQTAGIGSTGEADTKAVERGLKQYYISILKPVIEAIFKITTSFKSNDFRQITSGLEAIKTFELVSDDFISKEDKKKIIGKLFDIDLTPETT